MSNIVQVKTDEIPADLLAEVIDNVEDKLIELKELLDGIGRGDISADYGLTQFSRQIHSMKGLVGAFGLKELGAALHVLEDYLCAHQRFDSVLLALMSRYVSHLRELHRDEELTDPLAVAQLDKLLASDQANLRPR